MKRPSAGSISARLIFVQTLITTTPKTWRAKQWKRLQEIWSIGVINIILGVVSLSSLLLSEEGRVALSKTIFFASVLIGLGTTTIFWSAHRAKAEAILQDLIQVARQIEERSTEQQLAEMRAAVKTVKVNTRILSVIMVSAQISYTLFPAMQGMLPASVPLLPEGPIWFWAVVTFESSIMVFGHISMLCFEVYHSEICLSVAALNNALCGQFEDMGSTSEFFSLIRLHQALLDGSISFSKLLSPSSFTLTTSYVTVLTGGTVASIISNASEGSVFKYVIFLAFFLAFNMYSLGAVVAESSQKIAEYIYRSDWVNADMRVRSRILTVMLRSQRPTYLKAGLIGNLSLPNFLLIMNRWYKLVQALLNLSYG